MKMGAYELLEVVGKGSMGVVHRGRHDQTGQIVAVKIMPAEIAATSSQLRRFEREQSLSNWLQHPHIVRGLDFGVEDGRPYLVMEFIEGETLARYVQRQGPVPMSEALRIIREVGEALHAAHDQGLVHRDVKPENVLLDAQNQAKLSDLGLAKDLEAGEAITRTGAWIGTVIYMAPEQFGDARHVDRRCDVYALAGTLHYVLTGSAPFAGHGNLAILGKKLQNDMVPLRRVMPNLPESLEVAIRRGLDANLERRPASCREFLALLEASEDEARDPATQPPAGVAERRASRRYPSSREGRCRLLSGEKRDWAIRVREVSRTGLRLVVARRFEPSTVLNLTIPIEDGTTATYLVRVRWVRQTDTRTWEMGCLFGRSLGDDDLGLLRGDPVITAPPSPGPSPPPRTPPADG